MANVIQVLEEGPRNYVIKVSGVPVDADALIVDVSALNPPCSRVKLMVAEYDVGVGGSCVLEWDATADTALLTMSEGPGQTLDFTNIGGINNPKAAGYTGDVFLTSAGAAPYTLVLHFVKKYD